MNIPGIVLDLLIASTIGWGAYIGYREGILQEVVKFLHFVLSFLVCFKLCAILFNLMSVHMFKFNQTIYPELVFAVSVLTSIYLVNIMEQYLKSEIDYEFPGQWDNYLGALFGFLKNIVVLSFVFWFMTGLGEFHNELQKKSFMYRFVEMVAYILTGVKDEDELSKVIRDFID